MAKTALRAPVNVTWEMTQKCNLRCVHCLSASGSPAAQELSFEECCRTIDRLAIMKVFQINIGGGEPFIRSDFLDLLTYAHNNGVVTCVSTNGTLIDRGLASHLAKLNMLFLQLSLDGATADVNDRIRGPGTYAQILAAAECLASHRVAFSINTVLTRHSYPQLDDLRKLARGYGAELRVSRFRPSGRGKDSRQDLAPSADQLEHFAEWLAHHDLVRTGDSFFCLTSESRRRKGLDMCGAAKMTCCISPAGDVYPCAFLQATPFLAGNVRSTDFQEMWDHASIFTKLRNLDIAACRSCSRFEACRGGCPAMAFYMYNDIGMPDPECLVNLKTAA